MKHQLEVPDRRKPHGRLQALGNHKRVAAMLALLSVAMLTVFLSLGFTTQLLASPVETLRTSPVETVGGNDSPSAQAPATSKSSVTTVPSEASSSEAPAKTAASPSPLAETPVAVAGEATHRNG